MIMRGFLIYGRSARCPCFATVCAIRPFRNRRSSSSISISIIPASALCCLSMYRRALMSGFGTRSLIFMFKTRCSGLFLIGYRPEEKRDAMTVADAERRLVAAYEMIEARMKGRTWVAGDDFSLADCAAAPALFFASIIVPFAFDQTALRAYFERLIERPSFRRVLIEAQPYFQFFPFRDRMPNIS